QIAAARYRLDDLPVRVVEGPPHVADASCERVVADDDARPYGTHQFVFRNEATGVPDQVTQKLETLWSEPDLAVGAPYAAANQIKCVPRKTQDLSADGLHPAPRR